MLVSWKRGDYLPLPFRFAGNYKLSSSMSDANLPFIIAQLCKAPGRGFQDGNAARPAVAPAPSTLVMLPKNPLLQKFKEREKNLNLSLFS